MVNSNVRWVLIDGICSTQGAEETPVYGVRAESADGGVWEWADVDVSPQAVAVLVKRLNEAQPEPCHYAEMIADFIEEQSIGAL